MKLRTELEATVGLGLIVLLVTMCASGCGGGGGVPTGVSGLVVDASSNQGIGNIVVTVGGQSATSETPEGRFTVTGVAPGNHQVVVQASAIFVPVSEQKVFVDVVPGQVTYLSGPLYVIDRSSLPPPPP